MARYRGPAGKIERRFGVSLELKGERRINGKDPLARRPYAPGQQGQNRRPGKDSDYGLQLREKQKARFMYGVSEKQFRRFFANASKKKGNTGVNLVEMLEQRLDNVVYRLGFASTRRFARQLVNHGHILVDGKKVDIPSFLVAPGSKISVREKTRKNNQVQDALEMKAGAGLAPWLELDKDNCSGVFARIPDREEVQLPFQETMIVEFYSK